jgi:hypothetical protein
MAYSALLCWSERREMYGIGGEEPQDPVSDRRGKVSRS